MSREANENDRAATISWEMLNAYVDGELEPAAAAQVAAAIAHDTALAARAATLSRLRAASRRIGPAEAAPPFMALPTGMPRFRGALAIAATLLVVVALGGLWMGSMRPAAVHEAALADAVAAHHQWLQHDVPGPHDSPVLAAAGLRTEGLPDLSAAAMRLVYVALDPRNRTGGVLAGYVGPNGCRVGIWIGPPMAGIPDRAVMADGADLSIRAWSDGRTGYAVMARGIAPARLEQLTALVTRAVREPVPEERLAGSPGPSSTCAG
ncbi:MAG: anti-sigma factor [Phreatobacter sp.]|uniref:anti-sigma factor n=1 Tax=Phreatobacter sp. TaxID=1966341 RepID=UPI001A3EA6ED|nr:anti-sigma factor [Phreatobacter sp.]MBL8571119.1 anti-sigma factor [Phreatobacter sp.]